MSDPRWRDLGVRAASGAVLAFIGASTMLAGGPVWIICVVTLGAIMSAEWVGLSRRARGGFRMAGLWSAGLAYIWPAIVSLIWLRSLPGGLRWISYLAAIVWAGDIGAYLVGRWVGGPRLAPRISPGKTWSGALGGTVCAVLAGLAIWLGQAGPGDPARVSAAALLLSIVAQLGDLLESALKRQFGVKDSSRLIPGHGGLLDRLDGVLTAAPAAAVLALASWP